MATRPQSSRAIGVGRVLIAFYAILALAATARSTFQLVTKFDVAPFAYLLSAFAGIIYIVATIALVKRGTAWFRVALVTITIELIGVLVVGTVSVIRPDLLPVDTVWSYFGKGYFFVPLVLPVLGLLWLAKNRPDREEA